MHICHSNSLQSISDFPQPPSLPPRNITMVGIANMSALSTEKIASSDKESVNTFLTEDSSQHYKPESFPA